MTNADNHFLESRVPVEKKIRKKLERWSKYNIKMFADIHGDILELLNQEKKLKNAKRKNVHK